METPISENPESVFSVEGQTVSRDAGGPSRKPCVKKQIMSHKTLRLYVHHLAIFLQKLFGSSLGFEAISNSSRHDLLAAAAIGIRGMVSEAVGVQLQ